MTTNNNLPPLPPYKGARWATGMDGSTNIITTVETRKVHCGAEHHKRARHLREEAAADLWAEYGESDEFKQALLDHEALTRLQNNISMAGNLVDASIDSGEELGFSVRLRFHRKDDEIFEGDTIAQAITLAMDAWEGSR